MAFIAKECYSKQITLWIYFSNSTQSVEMEIEWRWEFPFGSSPLVIGRSDSDWSDCQWLRSTTYKLQRDLGAYRSPQLL